MLTFDLATTPFSRRGTWLSLSQPHYAGSGYPAEGQGIYLRSNCGRPNLRRELVKIEILRHDRVIEQIKTVAQPDGVTIRPRRGQGCVELTLCAPGTLLVSAKGALTVRLRRRAQAGEVAHPLGSGLQVINCRQSLMRLAIECLQGEQHLHADWAPDTCHGDMMVTLKPDQKGHLEAALDSWQSTHHRGPRPSMAAARKALAKEFEAFRAALPRHRQASACELADYVLFSCTVPPRGLLKREAVLMSRNWMDSVWSWDNCFNAMALAPGHPKLAFDQLMLEADLQDADGAYPDAANDSFIHYNFSKPPVQGITYRWIQRIAPKFWTRSRTAAFYESVSRFTNWWLKHRRWPGSPLCHYLHGNDSGWDNSSVFDIGAPLEGADLAAFLCEQMRALADMAKRLGKTGEAARWIKQADSMQRQLCRLLWDGRRFRSRLAVNQQPVDSQSLIPAMAIVLGKALDPTIATAVIEDLRSFVTPWGIATEHPESERYESDGYWRGPIWAPSTFLIVYGLLNQGEELLAKRIARGFCKACEKSGFAENFDALTGAGLRDRAYTWTASVYRTLLLK
ncbi:MAG: glycogen debranching protein [Planctomycetota bacterium]|nr:MAG: glycogen debranching protein [Planctomycetota bacterium]